MENETVGLKSISEGQTIYVKGINLIAPLEPAVPAIEDVNNLKKEYF